jgi:ketosteroid isomerase-like protein
VCSRQMGSCRARAGRADGDWTPQRRYPQRMSLESVEVVVRGYRAFIDGDFEAIGELLDPGVEWYPLDAGPFSFVDQAEVLGVVAERYREQYRVELDRCVAVGDQVVVGFRASREERDATDPRPLQSRRKFSVERYSAVVTIQDGRVVRVQDYPHLQAAFEAVGLDESGESADELAAPE